jgi:DNA topoisomerase-1
VVNLPAADPVIAAQVAGLRYVSDESPGIRRRKQGSGFAYLGPDGKTVRDPATLGRIRSLAVPPAWTEVWICPSPNGHIQATGRDARGRKQYRYHARWRSVRDETKYHKSIAFARALPKIRARVAADLARPGLPREKVLACVVKLLESTAIRVGNEEYARQNGSVGLTTMKDRHVTIRGPRLQFRFKGKSARRHDVELTDERLARIVKRCRDIPGQDLFQYLDDDGEAQSIGSGDVNDYLRAISGEDFTAKDFRTWAGTVQAAMQLAAAEAVETAGAAKKTLVAAVARVAERLGNTPAVCRKCYIHPAVMDAYLDGGLGTIPRTQRQAEKVVLKLLVRRARRESTETLLARSLRRSASSSGPSRASRPRRRTR